MKDIMNNNHGTIFPPTMVYIGYVFLILGMALLMGNLIVGVFLILLSLFISFSFSGIDIDFSEKKYREYSIYFGIKSGTWSSLDRFVYSTVLYNREVTEVHSRANVTTSESENYFDVYLLDKLHREKLLIKRFKESNSAFEYAKRLSFELKLELTKYNPVLTAKTRRRRF